MLNMQSKNKLLKFIGSKKSIYLVRSENKITIYAAFIIKPFKVTKEGEENQYRRYRYQAEEQKRKDPLFSVLNEVKLLNTSLHRMFIPANVRKKGNGSSLKTKEKNSSSLIDELFEEEEGLINVALSFFVLKVWNEYDLTKTFHSIEDIVDDFVLRMQNELKPKLEGLGKIGRLLGETLKELVLYNSLNHKNFLSTHKNIFSDLTKEYSVIQKNEEFQKSFLPGPAVDKRPDSYFSFPTGIESDDDSLLGLSEVETPVGLPKNMSYPLLISGDKKTREIMTCKILEQKKRFIVLDPRSNLEFKERINSSFEYLTLGDNLKFNVLTPVTEESYISEQLSSQYLSNFIEIVRSITNVRDDISVLLRDLIEFYVNEYQEEQEDILFPRHDAPVTLDDLYSMLTIEPGGLVITDFQLSTIKALINDIKDLSISSNTMINDKRGLEQLIKNNYIIDFSPQGFKIQKLFLYTFLLQLTVLSQLLEIEDEILIYIDDAELFFSREIEKTILSHVLKKLENSPFKLIFSTPYPSQLASPVFDLTYNRIIGNLKSARCVKLISDTHGLEKNQQDFVRRLPKNNFLLIREDLHEKPLLLKFYKEDIERHETLLINRKMKGVKDEKNVSVDETQLHVSLDDYSEYFPIIIDILDKLASKANRGINTESLVKLFPKWEEEKMRTAVSLLELYGYIFYETVNKKGKGEYWTKITPRGKKFLEKLKFTTLIDAQNKEIDKQEFDEEEILSDFIEGENIKVNDIEYFESKIDLKKIQKLRKKMSMIRDSDEQNNAKLVGLKETLLKILQLIEDFFQEETMRLNKFLNSLEVILKEKTSLKKLPEKAVSRIFLKAFSVVDTIQIRANYEENSNSIQNEGFIEKVIENELNSEKWKDFDRDVFLTEIPELSLIGKENKNITNLLNSEFSDEVLEGLELTINLPKDDFISAVNTTIASLLKIKTMFFPNLDRDIYLEEIRSFFNNSGLPEPFEQSQKLLWEYSVNSKNDDVTSSFSQKNRREIIESIKEEKDSFVFELNDKRKDNLVKQLIESIRKRINNG